MKPHAARPRFRLPARLDAGAVRRVGLRPGEGRDTAPTALDEITVTASKQEEHAVDALAAVSITTQADDEITPSARAHLMLENIGDVRYKRYRDGDHSPGFVGKVGFTTRFGT